MYFVFGLIAFLLGMLLGGTLVKLRLAKRFELATKFLQEEGVTPRQFDSAYEKLVAHDRKGK